MSDTARILKIKISRLREDYPALVEQAEANIKPSRIVKLSRLRTALEDISFKDLVILDKDFLGVRLDIINNIISNNKTEQ